MSLDPTRLTNWPAIRDFVPTAHHDTYPFISTSGVDLSGKSVFITGASKGIEKGIALSFAGAGCSRVAVAARTGVEELKEQIPSAAQAEGRPKPLVLAIALDFTSSECVSAAAAAVSDVFRGVLDILINNAGRASAMVSLTEGDVDDYHARTVIITSSAGAHMLIRNFLGYQTSKTALCRFAESLAKEYEDQGLIAVAVHPSDVLTDVAVALGGDWAPVFKDTPELAGGTYVWLAKERREWLSGRFASVTWDM